LQLQIERFHFPFVAQTDQSFSLVCADDLLHNCSPTVNMETIAEALASAEGEICK
jgi:hypothetical protein